MQITFDFSAQRIVVDGPEAELLSLLDAVRKIAPGMPQITINTVASSGAKDEHPGRERHGGWADRGNASSTPKTMREFVKSIDASTHSQKISSIAYFLKNHDKKDRFSPKEMDGYYTVCGFTKPSSLPVALSDAQKKSRYIKNVSYGQWELDTDGENWVIGRLEHPSDVSSGNK